jgi:prolyl 4-hydroxylase
MIDDTVSESAAQDTADPIEGLAQWVAERHAEDYCPAQIFNVMVGSGWGREDALAALQRALPESLRDEVQALTRPAPEPDLTGSPSVIDCDGHPVQVLHEMQRPRLIVFGNLLTHEECDHVIDVARSLLHRSTVIEPDGKCAVSEARTSYGTFIPRGKDEVLNRLDARLATLLRWPVLNIENTQVLHYGHQQEFKPHHDYFKPAEGHWAPVFRRGGQRVATLLVYLNTPERGGGTVFPDVGCEVRAVKGTAVFFSYETANHESLSLHGGAPVLEGEKWVAVKWFRQGFFD